jgi:hypothetical protein
MNELRSFCFTMIYNNNHQFAIAFWVMHSYNKLHFLTVFLRNKNKLTYYKQKRTLLMSYNYFFQLEEWNRILLIINKLELTRMICSKYNYKWTTMIVNSNFLTVFLSNKHKLTHKNNNELYLCPAIIYLNKKHPIEWCWWIINWNELQWSARNTIINALRSFSFTMIYNNNLQLAIAFWNYSHALLYKLQFFNVVFKQQA